MGYCPWVSIVNEFLAPNDNLDFMGDRRGSTVGVAKMAGSLALLGGNSLKTLDKFLSSPENKWLDNFSEFQNAIDEQHKVMSCYATVFSPLSSIFTELTAAGALERGESSAYITQTKSEEIEKLKDQIDSAEKRKLITPEKANDYRNQIADLAAQAKAREVKLEERSAVISGFKRTT
jgi:hypothetical protein